MKFWKGKSGETWLTAVALVLGVLALAGGVALTLARNSGAGDGTATAKFDRAGGTSTSTKSSPKPLAIGSVAKVGPNYSVTVTDVTLYTSKADQYIAATLKAKYTGKEKGDPTDDLAAEYSTLGASKSQTSMEAACVADFGKPDLSVLNAAGQGPLSDGGSQTYVVCIDVPTTKIEDGRVSIAASTSGHQAFWATKGAPSKVAPAPMPTLVARGPVVNPAKTAKALKDLKKQLKKAKKARDILDDQIDAYEDYPDHKKKKLKKMKKALDQTDEIIDQMEKVRDQLE